ncbi:MULTISPECIES: hypothetical protein [unclassified Novosphingobium]|uniref:hypothetical protein n=1 Tax=unclassified Novosphingobium TaxID=2644732 RepID=UPI001ACA76E4|nr:MULTISPECIES: hypothetical protein [unclassified Novosphingobium]MBN9144686.1 hypothetical protein [Novosphingobium sp.]MDR6708270.1 hypothetical protein [Novosphingobium sp. 1748]
MIFALALAVSNHVGLPSMPSEMRGVWDVEGHCALPSDDSDSRVIVRPGNAVFWETVFTPKRILTPDVLNWTATGDFSEEGEVSKGRLNLRLSRDKRTLSYTNSDNRVVRLVRCKK